MASVLQLFHSTEYVKIIVNLNMRLLKSCKGAKAASFKLVGLH